MQQYEYNKSKTHYKNVNAETNHSLVCSPKAITHNVLASCEDNVTASN